MTIAAPIAADADTCSLYADYSGLPPAVVAECAVNHRAFDEVTWYECPGRTFRDKASIYYERHEEYLFGLVAECHSRARRREALQQQGRLALLTGAGTEVLDFGGGLGVTASVLRGEGQRVTYCDVDGPASLFARWYFENSDQNDIEIVLVPSTRPDLDRDRQWDVVLVDSVIELVPDPVATIDRLARAVGRGGLLDLWVPPLASGIGFPMRQPLRIGDLLDGSRALRAMRHEALIDEVHHVFRA